VALGSRGAGRVKQEGKKGRKKKEKGKGKRKEREEKGKEIEGEKKERKGGKRRGASAPVAAATAAGRPRARGIHAPHEKGLASAQIVGNGHAWGRPSIRRGLWRARVAEGSGYYGESALSGTPYHLI
jgi:hypothetical protein